MKLSLPKSHLLWGATIVAPHYFFAAQARRAITLERSNGSEKGEKLVLEYLDMTTKITAVQGYSSDAGKSITYQFNDAGNVVCMYDELGYAQSAKFESGIPNTASQTSRLQKVVINLVPNLDFSADWTTAKSGTDTVARDTSVRCLSMPSLKMVKAGAGETVHRITAQAEKAGRHTFSVYIRTEGLSGGGAYARLISGNKKYESRKVTASTLNLTGGPAAEGWERVYVTGEVAQAGSVTLELACSAKAGTVWFACPQLETGSIANRVNLLINADFAQTEANGSRLFPKDWQATVGITSDALNTVVTEGHGMPEALSGNALQMTSAPSRSVVAFGVTLPVSGQKGDTFVMGGWVNAKSVAEDANNNERKNAPCITYLFVNGSTGSGWKYLDFGREWVGWQYGSWPVVAPIDYTELRISINYPRNAQTAMFSNMFVHREQYGETFAYDDKKNLLSVANLSETKSSMKYDSFDNLTEYVQPGAASTEKYVMTYGTTDAEKKRHLLRSSTTPMGIKQTYEYDAYGNQTQASTTGKINNAEAAIKVQTDYNNGDAENPLPAGVKDNYVYKEWDARGNAVTKTVNPETYTLTRVTDPTGQAVNYTYDAAHRVTQVESVAGGKTYKNTYTYENDRIKTVSHNTTSNTSCDVTYTFNYDSLGRKTEVKVGQQLLSRNVYENDRSGMLKEVQYGNGGKVGYEYDEYDRLTGVKYDNETTPRYTYEYGANGQAMRVEDKNLNRVQQVEYDLAERPMQKTIRDLNTEELIYRTTLQYDVLSRRRKAATGQATRMTRITERRQSSMMTRSTR